MTIEIIKREKNYIILQSMIRLLDIKQLLTKNLKAVNELSQNNVQIIPQNRPNFQKIFSFKMLLLFHQ